jgi:hypothetical protein
MSKKIQAFVLGLVGLLALCDAMPLSELENHHEAKFHVKPNIDEVHEVKLGDVTCQFTYRLVWQNCKEQNNSFLFLPCDLSVGEKSYNETRIAYAAILLCIFLNAVQNQDHATTKWMLLKHSIMCSGRVAYAAHGEQWHMQIQKLVSLPTSFPPELAVWEKFCLRKDKDSWTSKSRCVAS